MAHVSSKIVKMLYFVFNFVLITYKGILQKDKCRDVYILLKERNSNMTIYNSWLAYILSCLRVNTCGYVLWVPICNSSHKYPILLVFCFVLFLFLSLELHLVVIFLCSVWCFGWLFCLSLQVILDKEMNYILEGKLIMCIFLEDLTMLSHHPYRANQGSFSLLHSHLFSFTSFI